MASKKAKAKKTGKKASAGGGLKGLATSAAKGLMGGKSSGGGKRRSRRGPQWYARKIATLKLKRKYDKLRLSV